MAEFVSRFVAPGITVLRLSGGDTLTVRTRLNAGERFDLLAHSYESGPDGRPVPIWPYTGVPLITAYLVDWSLCDVAGELVPIRGIPAAELASALRSLDPESFREIKVAIEQHDEAQDAARAEEKKVRAGSTDAGATSPSPYAAAGASSGYVS